MSISLTKLKWIGLETKKYMFIIEHLIDDNQGAHYAEFTGADYWADAKGYYMEHINHPSTISLEIRKISYEHWDSHFKGKIC